MKLRGQFAANSLLALGCLVFANQSSAAHDTYQFEVPATYTDSSSDDGVDVTAWTLGAIGYFSAVENDEYPYAESGFIARQSYVGVNTGNLKLELPGSRIEGNATDASAGYGNPKVPIALDLRYSTAKPSGNIGEFDVESSFISKGLTISYYLNDHSAIGVGYEKSNSELRSTLIDIPSRSTNTKSATYKLVSTLRDANYVSVQTEVKLEKDNEGLKNRQVSFGLDYYFDRSLGMGAATDATTGDDKDQEGRTFTIRASKVVNGKLVFGLSYNQFIAKLDDNSEQGLSVHFAWRI